jgi:hypothetical protein
MKTCVIALLALGLGLAGCQHQPRVDLPDGRVLPGTTSFPTGTYTNCVQGIRNPSGNAFSNVAGFESGAVLTLAQSGNTVQSTYVDQNGLTQSVSFSTTTGTSATLTPAGQMIPGFVSVCVLGPANERSYPASMITRAGALIYNAGTVFIALTGGLQADAGSCGTLSAPDASFWLLCQEREGGAQASSGAGSAPVSPLPAGQYACSSQVEARAHIDGIDQFVAGGGSGTLTLAQDGAKASAQYMGDSSLAGMLTLDVTTSTTANADTGQTLMAPCMVPVSTGTQPPGPLSIASGALTISESTLFLTFAGTMAASSSCPGAQVAGSVICTM